MDSINPGNEPAQETSYQNNRTLTEQEMEERENEKTLNDYYAALAKSKQSSIKKKRRRKKKKRMRKKKRKKRWKMLWMITMKLLEKMHWKMNLKT